MPSMDSIQAGIIKQACQVVFSSLLQCLDAMNLEVQVMCTICLGNVAHHVCKKLLADEEAGALLIPAYLTDSHCPWLAPLGPL